MASCYTTSNNSPLVSLSKSPSLSLWLSLVPAAAQRAADRSAPRRAVAFHHIHYALQPAGRPGRQQRGAGSGHGGREREGPFPFHEYGKIPGRRPRPGRPPGGSLRLCYLKTCTPKAPKRPPIFSAVLHLLPRSCTAASLQIIQRSTKRLDLSLQRNGCWLGMVSDPTTVPCVTLWFALALAPSPVTSR
jgi:hypothetical protein